MRSRALSPWFVAVAMGATVASSSPAAAAPMFMGLGDLPGRSVYSNANAISADGSVVVAGATLETGLRCEP